MQIHYSYRIEDFEDICVTADRLVPRSHRIRFASVIAGCLLLVAPFLTSAGPTHPDKFLLGMSPFGFCLLACGFQSPRRRARKIDACAVAGMEYDATITDEAIITSSPVARGELKWKAFSRVIEGDDALALVTDAVMYLFPKRAFSPAELDEFKSLISKHVPVWDGKSRTIRLL